MYKDIIMLTIPCPQSHVDTRKQNPSSTSISVYKYRCFDRGLQRMHHIPVRNYHP